ncbi:MAG: vWA domain-containing protein [Candidatus Spechtbacterales bacterium]|nr:vWA domain-containing protein [Candidatus Spechtbacterales bacterium]
MFDPEKQKLNRDEDIEEHRASLELPEPKEDMSEEEVEKKLKEFIEEAQEFLDSYRRFFITFAKDVSLKFEFTQAPTFYIDYESGTVHLAARWFFEQGYSKDQLLWAVLHELSHFRDMVEDPEAMEKQHDHVFENAKKTGEIILEKWEDKYGKSDPELVEKIKKQKPISPNDPDKTLNRAEQGAHQIHHTFWNIMNDIYVNKHLARRAVNYEPEEKGGEEAERLYKEKLFDATDYTKTQRHLQFVYALLRNEMVPGEELQLSPDVEEALNTKIKFQGKEYTPKEIIDIFITPRSGRDTTVGQRDVVIRNTIEPLFEELLMKDLEEWEPEIIEQSEGGQGGEGGSGGESGDGLPESGDAEPEEGGVPNGNPFDADYREYKEKSPDQLDPHKMNDFREKYQEEKKKEEELEEEDAKTAEEKANEVQKKMDKDWAEKNDVSMSDMRRFRHIEQEIAAYLDELAELWQHIIYGSSVERRRDLEGHFKTGIELDMQKVIDEWPKLQEGEFEDTRTMKRQVDKETEIRKPERIRVRLVGDLSGSMDYEKRHVLEQCIVLVLSSLREFNTYLNMTRSETKSELEVDTEAWVFGDYAERIKKFREETNIDEEQVEIVSVFTKLRESMGSTHDYTALREIEKSLSEKDLEDIKNGKLMEIVLEVTDGGSSDPRASRQVVDSLDDKGVIIRAIQIGDISWTESTSFSQVWNQGVTENRGGAIGENIEELLPVVTELLKQYLKDVRA